MLNIELLNELIHATRNATLAYHSYLYTDKEYVPGQKLYLREMHFLVFVGDNRELTMSEIAEKMDVTQGAATQISSRLIKKDLICKRKSSSDKRYSVITLTPLGKEVYDQYQEYGRRRNMEIASCITDFTEEDIQTILRYERLIVDICEGKIAPAETPVSHVGYYQSPVGILRIEENGIGISLIRNCKSAPENLSPSCDSPLLKQAKQELDEYFAGTRKEFTVPLSLHGTDFQIKVWNELRRIPYGETRSYGEIAALAGNASASRAVGMANNKNPIMIMVPCHRVIGKNGSLTGYAGGLDVKEKLLQLESR